MATMDFKNATLKIKDGAGSPKTLTVLMGEGNLTWSEKKPRIYDRDRDKLGSVRNGAEEPMEVSFSFRWEFLKSNTTGTPTVEDALKKRGEASNWVSTSADLCEPYAVDLEFEFTPICSGVEKETIVFPDFRYESLDHDARGATVSVTGMCNALEPTVTRS